MVVPSEAGQGYYDLLVSQSAGNNTKVARKIIQEDESHLNNWGTMLRIVAYFFRIVVMYFFRVVDQL